ncbi:uncharacterized protein LOC128995732 [Macrosteles quadrilineatus]|uniref:uncharacterized protein LOC128995732 n=1 Tax=Macrosteles quadrilineatus TaxID=74068 RepID=UPI0023E1407E|nr:uncharacterized protein LOC128995732 [Macrosteles quadrilineatus]
MVSSSANIRPNTRGGPYMYVVNGQVHHRIGITPDVEDRNNSRYSQVYFYDSEEASNIRCSIRENEDCDPILMQELSKVFEEINPYSQAFKTLGQVLRETPPEQRENVRMVIYSDRKQDNRRYNLPTSNDVAAIFKADDGCPVGNPEFVIYPKIGAPEIIAPHCSGLDPMAYPLLFPYGEQGWFRGMPQVEERATAQRNKVTQLQFASHRLSVRQQFSPVLNAGKISLQYIVDMFTRIEGERLAFIKSNQSKLRAELYVNLHDAIQARADNEGLNIGRQVILPRTFQGSFRNMHSNYLDAMAIVRQHEKRIAPLSHIAYA